MRDLAPQARQGSPHSLPRISSSFRGLDRKRRGSHWRKPRLQRSSHLSFPSPGAPHRARKKADALADVGPVFPLHAGMTLEAKAGTYDELMADDVDAVEERTRVDVRSAD